MKQPTEEEFHKCLKNQWYALFHFPKLIMPARIVEMRTFAIQDGFIIWNSKWYKEVYYDYDADFYVYAHRLVAWAFKFYYFVDGHCHDLHRFLLKKNIIQVKPGDYLSEWKFNRNWRTWQ